MAAKQEKISSCQDNGHRRCIAVIGTHNWSYEIRMKCFVAWLLWDGTSYDCYVGTKVRNKSSGKASIVNSGVHETLVWW